MDVILIQLLIFIEMTLTLPINIDRAKIPSIYGPVIGLPKNSGKEDTVSLIQATEKIRDQLLGSDEFLVIDEDSEPYIPFKDDQDKNSLSNIFCRLMKQLIIKLDLQLFDHLAELLWELIVASDFYVDIDKKAVLALINAIRIWRMSEVGVREEGLYLIPPNCYSFLSPFPVRRMRTRGFETDKYHGTHKIGDISQYSFGKFYNTQAGTNYPSRNNAPSKISPGPYHVNLLQAQNHPQFPTLNETRSKGLMFPLDRASSEQVLESVSVFNETAYIPTKYMNMLNLLLGGGYLNHNSSNFYYIGQNLSDIYNL